MAKSDDTATRLLTAAGRGFRRAGFGGAGVDGLAREAGLTSGAFYAAFKSKGDAFRAVVAAGLDDLRAGISRFRAEQGADWLPAFVDFYLGDRLTCELAGSCALQSLSGDVGRADAATRRVYATGFDAVVAAMTDGEHGLGRSRALALLAFLAGGVTIARAAGDPATTAEIATAIRPAALALA